MDTKQYKQGNQLSVNKAITIHPKPNLTHSKGIYGSLICIIFPSHLINLEKMAFLSISIYK